MTPQRWQKIDQLFHAALARRASDRASFLANACAGDEPLRLEVESLISFHEAPQSTIERPGDIAAEMLSIREPRFEPGHAVGNYRIIRQLGSGGMGEVYLAHDARLNRKIALKLLPEAFTADTDRVRRFEQEARAASALNHPNIVTIYEIGESNSAHFIAIEFIDGVTLRGHLARGELTLEEVLEVAAQVASALTAAHDAGIVHRDIKPENIMLRQDGLVKVLDFGLAKLLSPHLTSSECTTLGQAVKTDPEIMMGTVHYMSPEQVRGDKVDHRTDIWSLGVVLYEMVTGNLPFTGATSSHVIVSILEAAPPPTSHYVQIPAELDRIVMKALSKTIDNRYQTASAMGLELKSLRQELTVEARLQRLKQNGKQLTTSKFRVAMQAISIARFLTRVITRHNRSALAAMLVFIMGAIALSYLLLVRDKNTSTAYRSIAVLPFKPMSSDETDKVLGLGMADALIIKLGQLNHITVVPTSTVRQYVDIQNVDVISTGQTLKVDAVLEGAIQRTNNQLRVTVQLINVKDGRQIWAEKFEDTSNSFFEVQDAIAARVANSLTLQLTSDEKTQLERRNTNNPEAFQLYVRGQFFANQATRQGFNKGVELLEQAIKLDSNYDLAYAGLSSAYFNASEWHLRPHEAMPKAKFYAEQALRLNEKLPEAHERLAWVKWGYDWDWLAAEREIKRALELNPNHSSPHNSYSWFLSSAGRHQEAIHEAKRAEEINPLEIPSAVFYFARDYDQAIRQLRKGLELQPNNPVPFQWLGLAYEQKGMYEESIGAFQKGREIEDTPDMKGFQARVYALSGKRAEALKILAELQNLSQRRYVSPFFVAIVYAALGQKDEAFIWLERAYQDRSYWMTALRVHPQFDSLRNDPRYAGLFRKVMSSELLK